MIVRNSLRQALLASFLALACTTGTFASETLKRECPNPAICHGDTAPQPSCVVQASVA